jgi:hypothetical protein
MNQNYHKAISVIFSVAFLVTVQIFAAPLPVFRYLLPAFILFCATMTAYNVWYLRRIGHYNIWWWVRPILFVIGWFALFFIIPGDLWRGLFLLLGLPIIYLVEFLVGNSGQQLLMNETLITAFAIFMSVTQFSHTFATVPQVVYLGICFAATLLLVRASYEAVPRPGPARWYSAAILALLTTELFWALSFLPLHFSALGLMMFNIFYFCWVLYYYALYDHLNVKQVQYHLALGIIFTAVILAVTPWKILT